MEDNGAPRRNGGRPLFFLAAALCRPLPGQAAMILVHSTPLDFRNASVEGPSALPFAEGLFEGTGTIRSAEIAAAFPFDDLVGSWNADLPPGAALELDVQIKAGDAWSGWYGLGRWDAGGGRSLGAQEDALGSVDVDTLKLKKTASAFRYRVLLSGGPPYPRLTRVALTYVDASREPEPSAVAFATGPWVRELKLAPRSQMLEQGRYKHDICSPTSLSMDLAFWGKDHPVAEVAATVQDRASQLYGNWTLNVAAAARWGLSGEVARLSGFDEAQAEIARGRPVVVSIAFGKGALSGAPIPKTKGHLVVVAGFTSEGDVIVYDPAAPDAAGVRRVYRRAEFARAWLGAKRGLAYVLGPRFPERLRVGAPVADLRRAPEEPAALEPQDPDRLTQLLYGEAVEALEARGGWARVRALEQPERSAERGWDGYEGWVRADALTGARFARTPNAVIRRKQSGLEGGPTLSIGTRLPVEREADGYAFVRLLDGRAAKLPVEDLRLLEPPSPPSAERILEAAAQFLGDGYVWGGRSGLQPEPSWGVDCSGLVNLAYRAEGVDLPRDAQEQFLKATPIRRAELRPGDLVFLSRPGNPKDVTHVLLYAGGDSLLESRSSSEAGSRAGAAPTAGGSGPAPGSGAAVRTTFRDRFGEPLSAVETGDAVTDATAPGRPRRTIHFGAFLHPAAGGS